MDLQILKTELTGDSTKGRYAAAIAAGDMGAVANLLNEVQATITVRRPNVTPNEILEAIDSRDLVATTSTAHCAWFESSMQNIQGSLRLLNDDGSDTTVLGNIKRMLLATGDANYKGSRERLTTVANRKGSRAEQLFGVGTVVSWEDVKAALAS